MDFPEDALGSTWYKTSKTKAESNSLTGLRIWGMAFGSYRSDWKLRSANPRKRDHKGSRPQIYLYHPLKPLADP